jgi:hypothetical protein
VQLAIDPDARNRGTGDGGEQGSAEGVSEGVTETGLQRFNDETGAVLGYNFFRQGGALCNEHLGFLSASIRYMTQHRWWKSASVSSLTSRAMLVDGLNHVQQARPVRQGIPN